MLGKCFVGLFVVLMRHFSSIQNSMGLPYLTDVLHLFSGKINFYQTTVIWYSIYFPYPLIQLFPLSMKMNKVEC